MGLQPFRWKEGGEYEFQFGDLGDPEPAIQSLVLRTISSWSLIDQQLGIIAANCLRANARVIIEMLNAIVSTEGRRAALCSIVASRLGDSEDGTLFNAIEKCVNSRRKTRNLYVHWLWGICKQLPDRLILANPAAFSRDQLSQQAQIVEMRERTMRGEEWDAIPDAERGFRVKGDIYVLSLRGARLALRDATECQNWLRDFDRMLFWREVEPNHDHELAAKRRSQLRSSRPIRDVLSRLTKTGSPATRSR